VPLDPALKGGAYGALADQGFFDLPCTQEIFTLVCAARIPITSTHYLHYDALSAKNGLPTVAGIVRLASGWQDHLLLNSLEKWQLLWTPDRSQFYTSTITYRDKS